eukprot:gene19078-22844_t
MTTGVNSSAEDDIIRQRFTNWMKNYGKQYDSSEMQERFENFKNNLKEIDRVNSEYTGNRADIQFDDVVLPQPDALQSDAFGGADGGDAIVGDAVVTGEPIISYPNQNAPLRIDLSYIEFVSIFTGAEVELVTVAAVGLSAGAIAGIVVAGVVASAAVGAGVFVGVKNYNEKKKQEEHATHEREITGIELVNPHKPANGINVMDGQPKSSHQSITARAVPIMED